MKKNYKILGLKLGATLYEVEEKYSELLKEFDPEKQSDDLKEFFKSERLKVKEAYKEISASLINTESLEQKMDETHSDTNEIDSENQDLEESLADEIVSDEATVDNNLHTPINYNKKESYIFRNLLLLLIVTFCHCVHNLRNNLF